MFLIIQNGEPLTVWDSSQSAAEYIQQNDKSGNWEVWTVTENGAVKLDILPFLLKPTHDSETII
jgi:hypothetical protein